MCQSREFEGPIKIIVVTGQVRLLLPACITKSLPKCNFAGNSQGLTTSEIQKAHLNRTQLTLLSEIGISIITNGCSIVFLKLFGEGNSGKSI